MAHRMSDSGRGTRDRGSDVGACDRSAPPIASCSPAGAERGWRAFSRYAPKALATVAGRPFLDWLLEYLCAQPITRIVLSVGHHAEQITARYGTRFDRLAIVYAREEQALGTGGAIRFAMRVAGCADAFAVNGDTFAPVPLARLQGGMDDDIVVALRAVEDASRYGSVRCEGDRIVAFGEKRASGPSLANAGVYWMRERVFAGNEHREVISLEHDVLERGEQLVARGILIDVPFVDIGTPEALAQHRRRAPAAQRLPVRSGDYA